MARKRWNDNNDRSSVGERNMSQNKFSDGYAPLAETSGVQTVEVISYELLEDSSALAEFSIIAKDLDSGATFVSKANFGVKKVGSGNAEIVGSVVYSLPVQSDLSMSTASVSVDVSGSNLTISVHGILLKNICWYVQFKISGIQTITE